MTRTTAMAAAAAAALLLAVLAALAAPSRALKPISSSARCGAARVAISVSPLVQSSVPLIKAALPGDSHLHRLLVKMRQLELTWDYPDARPGDRVALYDYDPVWRQQWDADRNLSEPVPSAYFSSDSNPARDAARGPLASGPTDGRFGVFATGVQEQHTASGQLGYRPQCLNYWATYERPVPGPGPGRGNDEAEVLAVSCLRTRPTWMADFRREIGHLRLVDLFIPGTHDSASAREDGREYIVDRYSVTQDESVLGQLIYGVRYIDLRVGFYSGKGEQWWANHGPVKMQPLQSVLSDVKSFIDNTNEIVILDVQEFPEGFGADNRVHLKLVHLLETELGELMAAYRPPGGWRTSLDDLWAGRRRLIVAYDKHDVLQASGRLWPAVRQSWGDVQTREALNEYMQQVLQGQALRGIPWALMAELTPNARFIAAHPTRSLRRLADHVSRNVTSLAFGPLGEGVNVLAVDFFRSTGVVEAAVWHSLRRGGVDVCNAFRLLDSV